MVRVNGHGAGQLTERAVGSAASAASAAYPVDVPGPRTVPWAARRGLPAEVATEVRASFRWPMVWLTGLALNLALSLLWLLWEPLTGQARADWVVLVGTYFATFILADVTTTNVLGPDEARVQQRLSDGVGIGRVLLVKNLALIVIVGLPTLLMTAVLTVTSEDSYRLAATVPGVALPILLWLGVGDVVSAMLPVRTVALRRRWQRRRDVRGTLIWLVHLGLPYVLLYAVQPLGTLPRAVLHEFTRASRTPTVRGVVVTLIGLTVWLLGLSIATQWARWRGLRFR